jgi:hypothetical protein
MQSSPDIKSAVSNEIVNEADVRRQRTADRVYQWLTLAAMVFLLASLWVF